MAAFRGLRPPFEQGPLGISGFPGIPGQSPGPNSPGGGSVPASIGGGSVDAAGGMAAKDLIPLLPLLLGLLGGGGGATDPNLQRLSGLQATDAQRQQELLQFLTQILQGGGAGMPRGERPPTFQFPEEAGGPSLDPAFLEGLQPAISPEFQALMSLAGVGLGTGGIQQVGSQTFRQNVMDQQSQSQIASDIIQLLLSLDFSKDTAPTNLANLPTPADPNDPFQRSL